MSWRDEHFSLEIMDKWVHYIKKNYVHDSWTSKQIAVDLVTALDTYIEEVQAEYDIELSQFV